MNAEIQSFAEELRQRSDVLGVILFGSWARGNNRPNSDADLVVILTEGYRRTVEYRNQQAFEIIYVTAQSALDFLAGNLDDCAEFWTIAKVLVDKDGTIQSLQKSAEKLLQAGKQPIDKFQLGQWRFDAEDHWRYLESILDTDPVTANMMLTNKVFGMTGAFFDVRCLWTPPPKQRLAILAELSPEFHALLRDFYQDGLEIKARLHIARQMVPIVFQDDP
ncbi:nucleotidyltransferase domain-containing protein [Chloroflexi bacterium TSY]|nr:nucleotidyltransferase domain-containing protein [Chloroflexi bacterium TSY]